MEFAEQNELKTSIYFEEDSLKRKLSYANKIGVRSVILIGEEEALTNKIKIKDMVYGNETIIDYTDL